MIEWEYIFIIFIIIIFVICILYLGFYSKSTECIECNELSLYEKKNKQIFRSKSEKFKLNHYESIIFYGKIPENCDYWSLNIYECNGKSVDFLCSGNYQSFFPDDMFCVVCYNNKYCLKYSNEKMLEIHNQKSSNLKLHFNTFLIEEGKEYYLKFESFLPEINYYNAYSLFSLKFDNILYNKENKIIKYNNKKCDKSNALLINFDNKFEHYKKCYITYNKQIYHQQYECLINISDKIVFNEEIIIIVFDYFMKKLALHSQILVFDSFTNELINIYFVTSKTNRISSYDVTHTIKIKKIEKNRNIYIMEKIFFGLDNESKPKINDIYPLSIYYK